MNIRKILEDLPIEVIRSKLPNPSGILNDQRGWPDDGNEVSNILSERSEWLDRLEYIRLLYNNGYLDEESTKLLDDDRFWSLLQSSANMTYNEILERFRDEDPLYECNNKDEDGNVIDPISLEVIPREYLISFIENNTKFCFDIRELYILHLDKPINPLTNLPLNSDTIEKLEEYGESVTRNIKVDGNNITVTPNTRYGDLLVDTLRTSIDTNILEASTKYDVLINGRSVYDSDLNDLVRDVNSVSIQLFPNEDEMKDKIINLFLYTRKRQSTHVYDSLYRYLGTVLALTPSVQGANVDISPTDTLGDVVIKIYKSLGGIANIEKYKLLDSFDRDLLLDFDLYKLAVDQIPSEQIHIDPRDEDDTEVYNARDELIDYLSYSNNRDDLHVLSPGTMTRNQTLDYIISLMKQDADPRLVIYSIRGGSHTVSALIMDTMREAYRTGYRYAKDVTVPAILDQIRPEDIHPSLLRLYYTLKTGHERYADIYLDPNSFITNIDVIHLDDPVILRRWMSYVKHGIEEIVGSAVLQGKHKMLQYCYENNIIEPHHIIRFLIIGPFIESNFIPIIDRYHNEGLLEDGVKYTLSLPANSTRILEYCLSKVSDEVARDIIITCHPDYIKSVISLYKRSPEHAYLLVSKFFKYKHENTDDIPNMNALSKISRDAWKEILPRLTPLQQNIVMYKTGAHAEGYPNVNNYIDIVNRSYFDNMIQTLIDVRPPSKDDIRTIIDTVLIRDESIRNISTLIKRSMPTNEIYDFLMSLPEDKKEVFRDFIRSVRYSQVPPSAIVQRMLSAMQSTPAPLVPDERYHGVYSSSDDSSWGSDDDLEDIPSGSEEEL